MKDEKEENSKQPPKPGGAAKFPNKKKKLEGAYRSDQIVLGFRYDDYETEKPVFVPKFRKKQDHIDFNDSDILTQNRFRFIVKSDSTFFNEYSTYSEGDFANVDWDDIEIVFYYFVESYQCPICLESKMLCPMITRCGHVFCWPCLISYYNYSTIECVNKKVPKCPLCSDKLSIKTHAPKFCEIVQCHNYTARDSITFHLVMRDKASPSLYNVDLDSDLSQWKEKEKFWMNKVPFEDNNKFCFGRFFYSNKELMHNRLMKYKNELEEGLKEEMEFYADEKRIKCINMCIDEITSIIEENQKKQYPLDTQGLEQEKEPEDKAEERKKSNSLNKFDLQSTETTSTNETSATKSEEPEINYNKYFFFYQESYGDIYYLHPLNYQMLLEEFKDVSEMPTEVEGSILDIEIHQVTRQFKSQNNYLSHLLVGSIVFFVEINLNHIVSPSTKKRFASQLKERERLRRLLSQEEKEYEKFIQIKENEEKEKNQREMGYPIYNREKLREMVENNKREEEKEKEKESKKENEDEKEEEKKESSLKKLFIEEEEKILKEKRAKEFMFVEEEFPDASQVQKAAPKKSSQKKGGKKKKNKFQDFGEDVLLINQMKKLEEEKEKKEKKEKESKC